MSYDDDYAYSFQYADKSAFQIYADGRAFIVFPDGRREQKTGVVDNRIPLLIGRVAKPRQDEIERLEEALKLARGDLLCAVNEIDRELKSSPLRSTGARP